MPRRTTSCLPRILALALVLAALSALVRPALALADEGQVSSGFAIEASVAARATLVTTGTGVPTSVTLLSPGLFAGYKGGRLLIGVGVDFTNVTGAQTGVLGGTINVSYTTFLIGPELALAMVRSSDERVELVGDLALHLGHAFIPNVTDGSSNFLLSYQVGPGVRFWVHPHFALQALTGVAGQLVHLIPPSGSNQTSGLDTSAHGIFGSFGMLGVF